jgi:hypothetical protein
MKRRAKHHRRQNRKKKAQRTEKAKARANGRRYRQGRELADKATRRRIRRWGRDPESVGESPHLSGARGVGWRFAVDVIFS